MKTATLAALLLVLALPTPRNALAQRFTQTNLVSDLQGEALRMDANLVNPWGLAPGGSGVFWAANNVTGTSTLYDPDGTIRPLVVTIPGGSPTGVVATAPTDSAFDIPNGGSTARALFIFVTQHGTIAAWSPAVNQTNAIQVESDPGAIYTGAALGGTAFNPLLYVANFAGGHIEAYDTSFVETKLSGSFTDPNLPAGYFPFNVQNVGGKLYVTYAQQESPGEENPGPGLGIINVFDFEGNLVRRFTSNGELNAPWGVVRAPAGFGPFGGDVLVGNFGDGRILAYDNNGGFQGAVLDTLGSPLVIHGLWGLAIGKAVSGPQVAGRLYFAAGIGGETHGLFGYVAMESLAVACTNNPKGRDFWANACPHEGDGGDDGDQGEDGGDGNGGDGQGGDDLLAHHSSGVTPDSLDVLFACVANAPAPNAFGTGGCFTADCSLLRGGEDRTDRERAAQVLLVTRLNLCAGSVCDSLPIRCEEREHGDSLTVGEAADSLDVLLCGGGSRDDVKSLVAALGCAFDDEQGDDNDQGEDGDGGGGHHHRNVSCRPDANPVRLGEEVRFSVTATTPAAVHMRIYDVRGRLVAEPMRGSIVTGSASARWDGRDLHGKAVSPGTFFYRTLSPGETSVGRFLIVR